MSDKTGIEWTASDDGTAGATWNCIRGCTPVGDECEFCYAAGVAARFSEPGMPYEGLARFSPKRRLPQWTGEVRFLGDKLDQPLRWRRGRRIFVNSMSDLFHEALSNEQIAAVFGVMAMAPQHTFQVLTKRASRMRRWFEWLDDTEARRMARPRDVCLLHAHDYHQIVNRSHQRDRRMHPAAECDDEVLTARPAWPLPNVWLGVSAGHQDAANERIPELLMTPAAVRWVSYEPALGPIDFEGWLEPTHPIDGFPDGLVEGGAPALDWIVIGGESGVRARPFDVAWAKSLIEQARGTSCKVFVKQLGTVVHTRNDDNFTIDGEEDSWPDHLIAEERIEDLPGNTGYQGAPVRIRLRDRKGGDMAEWRADLRVREFPEVRS